MKLSKQLENEVMRVYLEYWDAYITGDSDKSISYIGENISMFGSTEDEVFSDKQSIANFFISSAAEIVGKVDFRNRKINITPVDESILVTEQMDLYILSGIEWTFYAKGRLSSLLKKQSTGWKLIHQHGSFPDNMVQEGETIAFQSITKENLELKDAVKRRTVELENKNRELAIEASLERVRAVAMGMTKPDDLLDICKQLYSELQLLNFSELRNTMIHRFFDEGKYFINYDFSETTGGSISPIPYHGNRLMEKFITDIRKENNSFSELQIAGKELQDWKDFRKTNGEYEDPRLNDLQTLYYYNYAVGESGIGISTYNSISSEKLHILERFRNVFDLAYKRYIDITKAEEQAKEAQIQLALERVRARTMAMQRSDELVEVATVLFQQVKALGVPQWNCGFNIWNIGDNEFMYYPGSPDGIISPSPCKIPLTEHPVFMRFDASRKRGDELLVYEKEGEEQADHYRYMLSLPGVGDLLQSMLDAGFELPKFQIDHLANFAYGNLIFITYEHFPKMHDVFKRFAKVFEQTYTRFLDLQKAEAQAKEAQIEAALERARTQSMIMQHSNELDDTLRVFHQQVLLLGIHSKFSFLWLPDEKKDKHIFWAAWEENNSFKSKAINYPLDRNEPATAQCLIDWKSNQPVYSYHVPPAAVEDYFAVWQELLDGVEHLKPEYFLSGLHYIEAFMKYGCFGVMVSTDLTENEKKLLSRFAIEFERTYTRFLDLQRAEAQAREGQIETALEKVRSRTMGMQQSYELGDVATVLFKELNQLVSNLWTCGFVLCEKDRVEDEWWLSTGDGFIPAFYLPNTGDVTHANIYDAWKNGETYHTEQLEGKALQQHYEWLMNIPVSNKIFEDMLAAGFTLPSWQKLHCAYFSYGYLVMITQVPCAEEQIFKRFAQVFDQTYTRFLDLQKAEAQTRQAKIETALEKVRARSLAMQLPEELIEVAEVLRYEMGLLGVEELETCSIYIHDETINRTECWYALKDIKSEDKKLVSDHFPLSLNETWVGREMEKFFAAHATQVSIVMQGDHRKEWINYCEEKSIPLRGYYGEVIPDRTYHLYKFSHGAIGAASAGDISIESWDLLKRAASVFSLAYSRFKDLTQARFDLQRLKEEKQRAETALSELQTTQKQLIQAEKMASLGELTAGIAHEIQNPLNFVNNFSEVSNELISEMIDEVEEGNTEEVKSIAKDVQQNLEKILHHGKRADAIVKGMLQHSSSGSGKKESTDINQLADEYLRLAYHGLRAKDKSFNVTMKTHFDETIGTVNVIPQDIGRVVLNLITNAFYVVNERKNLGLAGYEPTVSVSTIKDGDIVLISVKDNGPGIPQKILDKIFQPFFTTKPTGQGTGLGLSLSYDIIKAHGGELKVETKEGEGADFIISLPVNR